jgi:hypothetical protein
MSGMTGQNYSPQDINNFVSSPDNKDLLNNYALLKISGQNDIANKLVQGTPLETNTGGALGAINRTLTGSTMDPVEGLAHIALMGGLSFLRNQQARNFLQNQPGQMQQLAQQQLQASRLGSGF